MSRASESVIFCPVQVQLLSDQFMTARLTSGTVLPLFDFLCRVCLLVSCFLVYLLCITIKTLALLHDKSCELVGPGLETHIHTTVLTPVFPGGFQLYH